MNARRILLDVFDVALRAVDGRASVDRQLRDMQLSAPIEVFAIGKAAGSPVYSHILSVIRDILTQMLEFHRHELFMAEEDDRRVLEHHHAIYEAIAAHQPAAADAAMRRHLEWVLEHYDMASGRRVAASAENR